MTAPAWANRTMWTGDNLDIMRGMNSRSSSAPGTAANGAAPQR